MNTYMYSYLRQFNMTIVQPNETLRTLVTPKSKSYILSPRHFPYKVSILLITIKDVRELFRHAYP